MVDVEVVVGALTVRLFTFCTTLTIVLVIVVTTSNGLSSSGLIVFRGGQLVFGGALHCPCRLLTRNNRKNASRPHKLTSIV